MTSDPGASCVNSAKVRPIAWVVRYIVTPSQLTNAGTTGSRPLRMRSAASDPLSKSAATKVTSSGTVILAAASWRRFQCWVAW